MKNFKRVISAVIALALSASTLVAVSANRFADVDNTTRYAEAIEVLTALDIIHGYDEEGGLVFKPEGEITRAEAATLIVGALNLMREAEAAKGTSQFTDVNEQASWASGFVNVGVAQGFIHGMDETTFAPQENVTYAQMCVMLTLITGYGDYAAAQGGYPTGYTSMAASAGIIKGVSLSNDAKLKRGQVAQMLYNAMTTPILGVTSYSLSGNEYAPQDGSKSDFKTILSENFDGFAIDAKITAVPSSEAALKKGEVRISTTKKGGEFLGNYLATAKETLTNEKMYDDFGVADSLLMKGKAVVAKDSNDDWRLLYFAPGANDTATAKVSDYINGDDGGKWADPTTVKHGTNNDIDGDSKITFGSRNYNLNTRNNGDNEDGKIYVNGKLYGPITEANVRKVLAVAQGEVTLLDDVDTVSGYDTIMVKAYNVGKVTAVSYVSEQTTIQVTTKAGINKQINTIKISDDAVEDGAVALTATRNGEAIALSSIKKDDIIAFAIDPTATTETTITDPDYIDILVTDDKISGKVTREDTTEKTYTVGDATYEEVDWQKPQLTIGYTYALTLDPFGRIYEEEVEASSNRYGIAEQYNSYDGLQVVRDNGAYKWYELNLTNIKDPKNISTKDTDGDGYITVPQFQNYINNTSAKPSPENRVIVYNVQNATGKINSIELLPGTTYKTDTVNDPPKTSPVAYKAKTGKLGNKTIQDSTAVLDISTYLANGTNTVSDYAKFAVSSFVDKAEYEGTVFDDVADSTIAALILLTKTGDDITEDSRFAVVKKAAAQSQTTDGDTCYSLNVLYEGVEKNILCTLDSDVDKLNSGDAFFFKTDSEGLVKSYLKVYDAAAGTFTSFGNTGSKVGTAGETFTFNKNDWDYTIKNTGKKDYQLVYGIVTDVTTKGVELAIETPDNWINLSNDDNYEVFGVEADCVNYRYGKSEYTGANNQYKGISVAAPQASAIDSYQVKALTDDTNTPEDETKADATKTDIYNLYKYYTKPGDTDGHNNLVYALAEVIDGDIVAIYTIVQ
jgi:hypothetical protein